MFQVGTSDVHAAFLAALAYSHSLQGRVEAWYNGEKRGEVEFESGSVRVTGRNRERRGLDLMVAEGLWPASTADLLTPYGGWVRALVTVKAGATVFPEIPLFAGKLLKDELEWMSGHVAVKGADPMWQVNREPFETLRGAPAGARVVDTVELLLTEVFPYATLQDLTGSQVTIPAGVVWDAGRGSRGKAIDDLATSIGAEVFARPTVVWPYGDFVIRPIPGLTDTPAWVFPDGLNSIVAADKRVQSGADIVNRWIMQAERFDAAPIWEPVTDDDPASPTRYGGPMGKLTDFHSSPLFNSSGQAREAGQARLRRSIGLARTRTVTVISNPALDAGDVLSIPIPGGMPEFHIADDFTVPLTADPADMTIGTRSTGGDV